MFVITVYIIIHRHPVRTAPNTTQTSVQQLCKTWETKVRQESTIQAKKTGSMRNVASQDQFLVHRNMGTHIFMANMKKERYTRDDKTTQDSRTSRQGSEWGSVPFSLLSPSHTNCCALYHTFQYLTPLLSQCVYNGHNCVQWTWTYSTHTYLHYV